MAVGFDVTDRAYLVTRNLGFVTPNGRVLIQDAGFSLDKGAVLAIAGPNGAGKTTLLNLLCGAMTPTTGDVELAGRALSTMTAADRAKEIAVVGQHDVPDGRLTLRAYVALGQIPVQAQYSAKAHAEHLADVLDMTDLTALADQRLALLSGGERQRAHIARALAQRPSLLFLDEPTNHLDPDAKGKVLSLVTDLGMTVVMVVHDLVMIPEFATHVALVKDARLSQFGPVADVLTPDLIHAAFGVTYLQLAHDGRVIPALDIRKTQPRQTSRRHTP